MTKIMQKSQLHETSHNPIITQNFKKRTENKQYTISRYKYKHTLFSATVNKTDFAVAITRIQLENPTLMIELWLRSSLYANTTCKSFMLHLTAAKLSA